MGKIFKEINKPRPGTSKKTTAAVNDSLRGLSFDNAAQTNIITTVGGGKIIMADRAACKLPGYSNKKLLTQRREAIFNVKGIDFKNLLKRKGVKNSL